MSLALAPPCVVHCGVMAHGYSVKAISLSMAQRLRVRARRQKKISLGSIQQRWAAFRRGMLHSGTMWLIVNDRIYFFMYKVSHN